MEFAIYVLITLLSALSIILGPAIALKWYPNEIAVANFVSFGLAVIIVLIGDRVANAQREKTVIKKLRGDFLKIPSVDIIRVFPDCDIALEYITARLPEARVVHNTKISQNLIESNSPNNASERFHRALKAALKSRNGIVIVDVISDVFSDYGKSMETFSQPVAGTYHCTRRTIDVPSFLNFTILDFGDEQKELIFGWATSPANWPNQKAFKVQDKRVIEYFLEYHGYLRRTLK